jgi:hypothetical protein
MSLAMTSSFFWASPCTLSLPASPSTPARAPFETLTAIALTARATTSISNADRRHQPLALLLDQKLGERDSTHVMFLRNNL